MSSNMNTKLRLVRCPKCRNVLAEPPEIPVYECGGCGAKLQAKKRERSTIDTSSHRLEENSLGKQKTEQVFDDQEAETSSNQRFLINSVDGPDRNSDHNDFHNSNKDQIDEPDRNIDHLDPRTSTELSSHEDPESSPEAPSHNKTNQEQKQKQDHYQDQHNNHDQEFKNRKNGEESEENRTDLTSKNPKIEKIELLKMVRELQDQLERTNISNNPRTYHHCCPQDHHFPGQVNGPRYGPNNYYSPHCLGPSSPTHHSEFELKPYNRSSEKTQYVRPIAGGSPWITCYRCLKILQMPQSFLVFKKRFHNLKCGACLKVLEFTVVDGSHVSRYYPEDNRVDPVSCSDLSFQKSDSMKTDRKGVFLRDPLSDSTGPSSSKILGRKKTKSEIEEVEPAPLHWLMGYDSLSKVIRV